MWYADVACFAGIQGIMIASTVRPGATQAIVINMEVVAIVLAVELAAAGLAAAGLAVAGLAAAGLAAMELAAMELAAVELAAMELAAVELAAAMKHVWLHVAVQKCQRHGPL